jgi:putative SOS response-associated peptidase YedK
MCGKFTQLARWDGCVTPEDFASAGEGPAETVTPMRHASVIRLNGEGERETARLRWGLVPPWTDDPIRAPIIHARAETIEEKKTFREAFLNRRGLVVVSTFNEGREIAPNKTEQHTITPDDRKPIAIAVIWERWTRKPGAALECFAMVTVPPNRLIATITDRMPAVIPYEAWGTWLGEEKASVDELKALLVPFEGNWAMQEERPRKPRRAVPSAEPDQSSLF